MDDASTSKQQVPRLAAARPEAGRGKNGGRSLGMTILIFHPTTGAVGISHGARPPHHAQKRRLLGDPALEMTIYEMTFTWV